MARKITRGKYRGGSHGLGGDCQEDHQLRHREAEKAIKAERVRNRQARQIRGAWYSSAVGYIFAQGKVACAFSGIMMDTGGDTGQSPLSGGPSMRTVHQQER